MPLPRMHRIMIFVFIYIIYITTYILYYNKYMYENMYNLHIICLDIDIYWLID